MKSLEADVINREMIRKEMQNGFSNSSTELADATYFGVKHAKLRFTQRSL